MTINQIYRGGGGVREGEKVSASFADVSQTEPLLRFVHVGITINTSGVPMKSDGSMLIRAFCEDWCQPHTSVSNRLATWVEAIWKGIKGVKPVLTQTVFLPGDWVGVLHVSTFDVSCRQNRSSLRFRTILFQQTLLYSAWSRKCGCWFSYNVIHYLSGMIDSCCLFFLLFSERSMQQEVVVVVSKASRAAQNQI